MSDRGRRWLQLNVRSPTAGDREGLLADGLVRLGARGVEERAGWFVAYFEEPDDPRAFIENAQSSLETETRLHPILIEHAWQDHEEWAETWKRGLAPRRVTERIVVHPSWAPPQEVRPGDVVIVLDPGMAFGTAEHGTTRGCLRLLDGVVRARDRVLDIGAGSGILAVATARLGAEEVIAVEGDALACEAMIDNVKQNGVGARVEVREGWADAKSIASLGPVSGIVANIESGLLRPLFEGFAEALPVGGWLIVSGILADEWPAIAAELGSACFRQLDCDEDGMWRSGLFERADS